MSEAGEEFGEFVKELRENKYEFFKSEVLPKIIDSEEVDNINEGCFSFAVTTKNYGVIESFQRQINFALDGKING